MSDKPFPPNPYVIGVPLTGDAGFYGRQDIFDFVDEILAAAQQNVVVLYGQRRVGKTSLLHQVTRRLRGADQVVPIYFDLQGKEQMSLGEVLYTLARTIAHHLKMEPLDQARFDGAGRVFRSAFLPSAYERLDDRRLLLLFDEFDVLGDELRSTETASETLFPYLNDLIMHQRQIAFIFIVGRRIEELTSHFQSVFKQAVYRRIGLLKPDNARAVITEPVKEVLTFDESAIGAILGLTTGHPYFTQLICFETFNDMKAKDQRVVTEADVLALVDQAIESGHGALNWFWDGLPRAERFIMSAVAHVTDETGLATQEDIRRILEKHRIVLTGLELKDAPDRLVEWEMLRREDTDSYRFVVELVRRWIRRTHPLESARRDVDLISVRASRMYENARDAHTAGEMEFARDEYRRALTVNPNHSGAQLGLAQVLFELGEIEASIEEFEKAYNIDEISARDGLVRARQQLGERLEEAGREEEALSQYDQAYRLARSNETTRRRLATMWRRRGDLALSTIGLAASFELYQRSLSYDPGDDTAAKIKASLSRYAEVDGIESGQDPDAAVKAIEQMQALGVVEQAEADRRLISIWLERGHRRLANSEVIKATEAYQQILARKPDEIVTRSIQDSLTAYVEQAEAGQHYEEAVQAVEQLNALLPENDQALAFGVGFWIRRGDVLVRERDKQTEAIQAYQRALELSPNDATLIEKLEAIDAEWERLLEADRLFNKALVAHQAEDWNTAAVNWLSLLKMDVFDYKGQNTAEFLAQAHRARIAATSPPEEIPIGESAPVWVRAVPIGAGIVTGLVTGVGSASILWGTALVLFYLPFPNASSTVLGLAAVAGMGIAGVGGVFFGVKAGKSVKSELANKLARILSKNKTMPPDEPLSS